MSNGTIDKQRVAILFLIAVVSASLAVGGAFAFNTLTQDLQTEKISDLCKEQEEIKEKVLKIEAENIGRDEHDRETKEFRKTFIEWQIKDAEWKGKVGEAINQSMYYGESGKLGDILKISEENKKALPKKNVNE